ncbi:restriction endonuclease [Kribbella sp. NPDC003505]|uniref:restriction endonuclease n=1 Tax=Kribbella sp. NPDC003505 TaxID=3154448 RepID=UPI0033BA5B93
MDGVGSIAAPAQTAEDWEADVGQRRAAPQRLSFVLDVQRRTNSIAASQQVIPTPTADLFTRMALDTQLFRADGDGGVDCVGLRPGIRGGKYVIQARPYRETVPPTAVRDLYGTMQHEGATTGILIRTSGYGPTSYDFANDCEGRFRGWAASAAPAGAAPLAAKSLAGVLAAKPNSPVKVLADGTVR